MAILWCTMIFYRIEPRCDFFTSHWLWGPKGVHQFKYFLPQSVHQIPIVACSCIYAFPLRLATIHTLVYALDPIAIEMNVCISKQQLESGYAFWPEVPKPVYAFWTLGHSLYILWLTSPLMCWNQVLQENEATCCWCEPTCLCLPQWPLTLIQ